MKRMTLALASLLLISTAALAVAADSEKCEDTYTKCLTRIGEAAGFEVKMEEPVRKMLDGYRVKAALGGKPEKALKKACGDVCKVEVKEGRATIVFKDQTRQSDSGVLTFICKDTVATSFGGGQGSTRLSYVTNESRIPCALREGSTPAMQSFPG